MGNAKRNNDDTGSIHILAIAVLTLLTVLGNSVLALSIRELWITRNDGIRSNAFYVAEGGATREMIELGRSRYPLREDARASSVIATHDSTNLPPPTPHAIAGKRYDFSVAYLGVFPAPKGYSTTAFVRYDYDIKVAKDLVGVRVRCGRIGPATPDGG